MKTIVVFLIYFLFLNVSKAKIGPGGIDIHEMTTCDEFSQFARFNPYAALDGPWIVFYYWAPPRQTIILNFTVPTPRQEAYLHYLLDEHVEEPINYTAKHVLFQEYNNVTSLLVEQNDRGKYNLYQLYKGLKKGELVEPIDMRFKQTGDNKYIAFMVCKESTVFVMSRLKEIPPKAHLQDAAARIGYRARGGKSYLYRGHEWMPIPEADESELYMTSEYRRKAFVD